MKQPDIAQWLVDWFAERNPDAVPPRDVNYYDAGLVDSFGIIELIEEIETEYAIVFDDKDFLLPEFRTIDGLAGIIAGKQPAAD